MSDHFLIGVKTAVETVLKEDTPDEAPQAKLAGIKLQTVNFAQVAEELKEYDWENSFKHKPVHEQVITFRDIIFDAMLKSGAKIKKLGKKSKEHEPPNIKEIKKRIASLIKNIRKVRNTTEKKKLQINLKNECNNLKEAEDVHKLDEEKKVTRKI